MPAFFELTKPRVIRSVILTSVVGFYLASSGRLDLLLLFHTLVGTTLLSGGAAALNEFIEREADGRMRRTCSRPLPSGRLSESDALIAGSILIVVGSFYLALLTNLLAAFLGCVTLAVYLLVYTPLKMKTPICTTIGAIPGAIPPLIGWAAAKGSLDSHALLLFAILFAWQFPHFLAISWLYKEDYKRAGFAMLSSIDPDGRRTGRRILIFTVILFGLSVVPVTSGLTGTVYLVGALVLGSVFLWFGFEAALFRTTTAARHVLMASVVYLPLLLFLMVIDKNG
ncbi:MAG: protoheme IX farnesyltransferase [Acidobacteria bacterium]|nr:MAG: protoheme IX farnesyltransferase [Acidobacteriota bacterium]